MGVWSMSRGFPALKRNLNKKNENFRLFWKKWKKRRKLSTFIQKMGHALNFREQNRILNTRIHCPSFYSNSGENSDFFLFWKIEKNLFSFFLKRFSDFDWLFRFVFAALCLICVVAVFVDNTNDGSGVGHAGVRLDRRSPWAQTRLLYLHLRANLRRHRHGLLPQLYHVLCLPLRGRRNLSRRLVPPLHRGHGNYHTEIPGGVRNCGVHFLQPRRLNRKAKNVFPPSHLKKPFFSRSNP